MGATGSDVGDPFLARPDVAVVEQHQPPVDDETMRRLRTPFAAAAVDAPRRLVPDADDHRGVGRQPRRGGDEG
jgi:hypothetical protein